MKIFLDSCDIQLIDDFASLGLVDGITTNPSIIAKSGRNIFECIKDICQIIKTTVSVEVMASNYKDMLHEAEKYCAIGSQITVKLPITRDGIAACKELVARQISVNMTLCFSPTQALIAGKIGATYVSPFIGRLDDIKQDGIAMLSDICTVYSNYPKIRTQIIVASVRHLDHIIKAAKVGADIVTISPHLLNAMIEHELTTEGLKIFMDDWKSAGQNLG